MPGSLQQTGQCRVAAYPTGTDARVASGAYRWVGEGGRDPLGVFGGDTIAAPIQLFTSLLEGGVAVNFSKPA